MRWNEAVSQVNHLDALITQPKIKGAFFYLLWLKKMWKNQQQWVTLAKSQIQKCSWLYENTSLLMENLSSVPVCACTSPALSNLQGNFYKNGSETGRRWVLTGLSFSAPNYAPSRGLSSSAAQPNMNTHKQLLYKCTTTTKRWIFHLYRWHQRPTLSIL